MELEQLQALPAADRWVFVRGRIVSEAIDMDAALRGVHAALRGRDDRAALLDASAMWSQAVKDCRQRLDASAAVDDQMRESIRSAIDAAAEAWEGRNRYMHDLLVVRIDREDDDPTTVPEPRAEDDRYRLRLARSKDAPEVESVALADAIRLVESIVAATWRLRAARHYLAAGSWRSMLRGHVEGDWEGNASWVGPDAG